MKLRTFGAQESAIGLFTPNRIRVGVTGAPVPVPSCNPEVDEATAEPMRRSMLAVLRMMKREQVFMTSVFIYTIVVPEDPPSIWRSVVELHLVYPPLTMPACTTTSPKRGHPGDALFNVLTVLAITVTGLPVLGLKTGATIAGHGLVACRVAPASSSYVGGAPPGEQVASQ